MTRPRAVWLAALGVCLLVAAVVARFASDQPDGLQRVAEDQGIAEHAVESTGLLDYAQTPAALLGLAAVLAVTTGLAWALRRRGTTDSTAAQSDPPARGS